MGIVLYILFGVFYLFFMVDLPDLILIVEPCDGILVVMIPIIVTAEECGI